MSVVREDDGEQDGAIVKLIQAHGAIHKEDAPIQEIQEVENYQGFGYRSPDALTGGLHLSSAESIRR